MENTPHRSHNRVWLGFWFLVIGAALLVQHMNLGLPNWVFSWPTFLIILGLAIGVRCRFRGPGWLILTFIGTVLLLDKNSSWSLHDLFWPIILIGVGIAFIISPKYHGYYRRRWKDSGNPGNYGIADQSNASGSGEDYIDCTAAFGGVKKSILSKNFKGGDVTSFMGGTELNLSQADLTGTAELDVTTVFGGTKLIIPTSWDVKSEIVAIFGGVEDKRQLQTSPDPNKILILKGTSIFGGIELRNF
jgi:predicted membrane protein